MLALVYVRQSRHKSYEATVSPEVQEEACRALPAVVACEEVVVYRDLDVSGGKTRGRAGYLALVERVKAGGVAVVAAYDQSRAFRNTADALAFFALMETRPDVEVVFVHGRFDRSAVGGFSYTVLAAAHEMERRMTGEKIRAAYAHLNGRGAPVGMPPYGYARQGGELVVVDEEAAVVRRIFDLYLSGTLSARAIAGRLNDEGVPRRRARSRFGWLPDTVVDVLRNVAYAGKTYAGGRTARRGDLVPAAWPPLVSEAAYWRAQELLGDRRVSRRGGGEAATFGRLLSCSACGETMRASRSQGARFYECRRDLPDAARCSAPSVREDVLDAWAEALFARLDALSPAELADTARRAGERRKTPAAAAEGVSAALERLTKVFTWGHISEAEYATERARLEALREELAADAEGAPVEALVTGVLAAWRAGKPAERRRLLGAFFERLYVDERLPVRYVARRDYREEVEELMRRAWGDGLVVELPRFGRTGRPSKKTPARYGEGGVSFRTLREFVASTG